MGPLEDLSHDGDLGLSLPSASNYRRPSRSSTLPNLRSTSRGSSPIDADRRRTLTRALKFPKAEMGEDILARLRRYLVCFAVVNFDIDVGPDLDNVYPPTNFSPALKANIAFSSLPEGDDPVGRPHSYSWRIPVPPDAVERDPAIRRPDKLPDADGFLYGFVYFVQEKNVLLRRGYSQRSLVLITHLPSLVGLFSSTMSVLGPLHFKHSSGGMVESACHNVAHWPDLVPGVLTDLPFLGSVQTVLAPLSQQPQWHLPATPHPTSSAISIIPAAIPLTPLSVAFHDTLSFTKVLLLWELVLLGEPILVFSSDPRTGSELVHHLRNLIRPILFAGDYRPYFHIHDTDFPRVATASKPLPGMLLAFTNPMVLSTLKSWPHVLRTRATKSDSLPAGLTSSRKRHLKKDASVAKAVEGAFAKGDYLKCDALIFQHLVSLTERFLSPLNRYFSTLPSSSTSLTIPPSCRSFQPSHFLTSLKSDGTPLEFRSTNLSAAAGSTAERFYARFLTSPNFGSWLHERMDRAGEEVRRRYVGRLEGVELREWIEGKDEGEVREMVERLEREAAVEEREDREDRGGKLKMQAERLRRMQRGRERQGSEGVSQGV